MPCMGMQISQHFHVFISVEAQISLVKSYKKGKVIELNLHPPLLFSESH